MKKWKLLSYPNATLAKLENRRVIIEKIKDEDSTYIGFKRLHKSSPDKLVFEERRGNYTNIGIGLNNETAYALYICLHDYFRHSKEQFEPPKPE